MAPLLIGLTGGIAAGKSEALAAFERLGPRRSPATRSCTSCSTPTMLRDRLAERWGAEVAAGRRDRSRPSRRDRLRPALRSWPGSRRSCIRGWASGSTPGGDSLDSETEFGVVEVPLLFETAMDDAFDVTVAVVADDETRRARAEERGHALVEERAARQLDQDEKAARADHVVRNDGSIEDLERELSALLAELGSQDREFRHRTCTTLRPHGRDPHQPPDPVAPLSEPVATAPADAAGDAGTAPQMDRRGRCRRRPGAGARSSALLRRVRPRDPRVHLAPCATTTSSASRRPTRRSMRA